MSEKISAEISYHLLEINAAIFLLRMQKKYQKPLTLLEIPKEEWKALRDQGFGWVWLMGLWKRSPGARKIALKEPFLLEVYKRINPHWKESDILGSPYAIYDYELDSFFGTSKDLLSLKKKINECGLKLMVDFVPNHLAFDHSWTSSHPEYFVQGSEKDLEEHPKIFFKTQTGKILAHGKDPYFDPWSDTVQVNFFSETAREKFLEVFKNIIYWADGVRCDMAMLALSSVFEQTWGAWIQKTQRPAEEFWSELIRQVKVFNPSFVFMAEAYWDLEGALQNIGFDYTYDKRHYDRLLYAPASEISAHLNADLNYQKKSVRFIENHDEERAMHALGRQKSFAAAMINATLPGLKLWMDGQKEGRRIRIPVQMVLEPRELEDPGTEAFYSRLFQWAHQEIFQKGEWKKIEPFEVSQGDVSYKNFLVWSWQLDSKKILMMINYSEETSRCRISLPASWIKKDVLFLQDEWSGKHYPRDSEELRVSGLYAELGPWAWHAFSVR